MSTAYQYLIRPTSPTEKSWGDDLTVLRGAYPRFTQGVIDALRERRSPTVLNLAESVTRFGNTAVDPVVIHDRLSASAGLSFDPPSLLSNALESSSVVFADWADKGAVYASICQPADARLTVRVHGVDTLSLWIHLVDFSRVSQMIFVSEHLKAHVNRMLGERIAHVEQHVIPNTVNIERFSTDKEPGAERTLGMVGWAQRVKDPLWAVEVLQRLRQHDPSWRLLLIGADVPAKPAVQETVYIRELQRALVQAEGVEFLGFTNDVPGALRRVGFGISSSLREGQPVGATELAASGAVPVIRNWPLWASLQGARTSFNPDWVVDDVDQAVARILRCAEPEAFAAERALVVDEVARRFPTTDTGNALRTVILGEDHLMDRNETDGRPAPGKEEG